MKINVDVFVFLWKLSLGERMEWISSQLCCIYSKIRKSICTPGGSRVPAKSSGSWSPGSPSHGNTAPSSKRDASTSVFQPVMQQLPFFPSLFLGLTGSRLLEYALTSLLVLCVTNELPTLCSADKGLCKINYLYKINCVFSFRKEPRAFCSDIVV